MCVSLRVLYTVILGFLGFVRSTTWWRGVWLGMVDLMLIPYGWIEPWGKSFCVCIPIYMIYVYISI